MNQDVASGRLQVAVGGRERFLRFNLIGNLIQYRELLFVLVRKDIQARYRQSLLGPAWAIFQPLILMVLFTIIRSFVGIPSEGIPYPIFVYSALLPWTFFSNSISWATPSLIQNRGIIQKIYFPRELFPLAAGLVSIFDFAMAFVLYVGLMIFYGIPVGFSILLLPVLLVVQVCLAMGISLVTSTFGVFRRDIVFAMPLLLQFWMFLCPVMYPLSAVPERYRSLYLLNPMSGIIDSYRMILVKGSMPELAPLVYGVVGSLVVLALGYAFFKSFEMRFADII